MPEISQEDLDQCIQLVYSRWSKAFVTLKAVKQAKNDGSTDWLLFHEEKMKTHTALEARWNALRLRLSPLHSLVKMRV